MQDPSGCVSANGGHCGWWKAGVAQDLLAKHMLAAPRLMMDTSRHDNRTLLVMYRVFGSG